MKIYIGENIKRLRAEKGITQEELADLLFVSFQTVSKWERNISYPDVEIIPAIANYFGVTIDELMGNSKVKEEAEITKRLQEYERLELEYKDEEKNVLAKRTYEEFPYDWRIINMYRHSLVCGRNEENYGDTKSTIRFLCSKILDGCTDNYIRQCAISSMLLISESKDEQDKYLSMLNDDFCVLRGEKEEEFYFQNGDIENALRVCRKNMKEYLNWFLLKLDTLSTYDMSITQEKKEIANKNAEQIAKIFNLK